MGLMGRMHPLHPLHLTLHCPEGFLSARGAFGQMGAVLDKRGSFGQLRAVLDNSIFNCPKPPLNCPKEPLNCPKPPLHLSKIAPAFVQNRPVCPKPPPFVQNRPFVQFRPEQKETPQISLGHQSCCQDSKVPLIGSKSCF